MEFVELNSKQADKTPILYGSLSDFKINDICCNTFKDGVRRIGRFYYKKNSDLIWNLFLLKLDYVIVYRKKIKSDDSEESITEILEESTLESIHSEDGDHQNEIDKYRLTYFSNLKLAGLELETVKLDI